MEIEDANDEISFCTKKVNDVYACKYNLAKERNSKDTNYRDVVN